MAMFIQRGNKTNVRNASREIYRIEDAVIIPMKKTIPRISFNFFSQDKMNNMKNISRMKAKTKKFQSNCSTT